MRTRTNDERGQATPLLALVVVVAGGAALLLGRMGEATVADARARSAADAAALAGVAEGREAAERLANDNGGRVVSWVMEGDDAQVTVEVGGRRVAARARRTGWSGGAAGGAGERGGLAPAMTAALARAGQLLGRPVPVVSGYRSPAQQARLWANRHRNPYPVARPGRSAHQVGMAVDVPRTFVPTLLAVAPAAGLCQPVPGDPVHFEPCRWKPRG